MGGVPGTGSSVQVRHLVGVLGQQTRAQHVGEQVVVAVPGAFRIERHHEQVVALELLQRAGRAGAAGHRVAQGTGELVEERSTEQERVHLAGLPGQHLVGEVVDDEPVAAGEGLDEGGHRVTLADAAEGEAGELQPGDPALRALVEGGHVGSREVEPHHLVQEVAGLGPGQPQVDCPELRELPTRAEPRQGEGRVGAGREHQVELGRGVVEEERHRLVHLGRADGVVVVEHLDPLRLRCPGGSAGHLVDEPGQGVGDRGARGVRTGRADIEAASREGRHQVGQEPGQVVVVLVQREPGDPDLSVASIELGQPVAERRGLAEAGRRGHQGETVARVEGGIELLDDA